MATISLKCYNEFVTDYKNLIETLQNYEAFLGKISENENLAPKTTFKIGGKARLYIEPENFYSFQIALRQIIKQKIKFFILGGGSNVVFPDTDLDYIVLSTRAFSNVDRLKHDELPLDFEKITLAKDQVLITCFSGTPVATLVNYCTEHSISGVEQFAGLPGSVGGAVYMNARCFDKSISDIIYYTTYMDLSDEKITLHHDLFNKDEWDYKKSPFQNQNKFITTATFLLTQKSEKERPHIESECKKYIAERVSKGHFKYPSAGSVFKNNRAFKKPSGQIIDEAGLRGYTIGGAKIADFHGNFIVNVNNAKAQDVFDLVKYVQKEVKNKYDFLLEPEIIFVDKK